jgi:formylglycine-generating enzyme
LQLASTASPHALAQLGTRADLAGQAIMCEYTLFVCLRTIRRVFETKTRGVNLSGGKRSAGGAFALHRRRGVLAMIVNRTQGSSVARWFRATIAAVACVGCGTSSETSVVPFASGGGGGTQDANTSAGGTPDTGISVGGGGVGGGPGAGGIDDGSAGATVPVSSDAGMFTPDNSRSCADSDGGAPLCNGESCCTSIIVPGGTFLMGRGTEDCGSVGCQGGTGLEGCPTGLNCWPDEQPEHSMTIGSFALDKYEATVGRFRSFVSAYSAGWRPTVGAGQNPNVTSGDTSWRAGWDDSATDHMNLPADLSDFLARTKCDQDAATWTETAGENESKAMNCVNWYEAFAFCIWDGGRLPTEAEWEYAATGGDQNRLYPWGSAAPDCTYAKFYDESYCPDTNVAVGLVGSTPKGNSRWGQSDLAGNVREWNLDWWSMYSTAQSNNYADTFSGSGSYRAYRGGNFHGNATTQRAAYRAKMPLYYPSVRSPGLGFRCARSGQ